MVGIILYKSKYGAARQYALWLSEALNITMREAGTETAEDLEDADYVIIGTSIYIGQFQVKEWLEKNKDRLNGKKVYLYIVCGTPANETDKLEQYYRNNVPVNLWDVHRRIFLPGRLIFSTLHWWDKFMLRTGAMLAKLRGEVIHTADYNDVHPRHLEPLLALIRVEMEPIRTASTPASATIQLHEKPAGGQS